jgi:hypothetical protein
MRSRYKIFAGEYGRKDAWNDLRQTCTTLSKIYGHFFHDTQHTLHCNSTEYPVYFTLGSVKFLCNYTC